MSQKYENLSALVDGEIDQSTMSSKAAFDALKDDPELQNKWQRYHIIRDGLRKEVPDLINVNMAQSVLSRLENEPVILAPKKAWQALPLIGKVVPFAKQGGQMAIAASVAVAMIIGVQQVNQQNPEQPFSAAPPFLGVQGGLSPVSLDQTRSVPNVDALEQRRRINAFMADHKQQLRFKTTQPATGKAMDLNPELNVEMNKGPTNIVEKSPE